MWPSGKVNIDYLTTLEKLTYLDIHKIIVRKGWVQCGNQVKQCFAADCVTQSSIFIPWHATTVLRIWCLWGWQSLQIIRVHSFWIESTYSNISYAESVSFSPTFYTMLCLFLPFCKSNFQFYQQFCCHHFVFVEHCL